MTLRNNIKNCIRPAFALLAAGTFALSLAFVPAVAFAGSEETRAELEQVQEKLAELNAEAEQCSYELQDAERALIATKDKITEVKANIATTQEQLAAERVQLASIVSNSYKTGGLDIFSIIFSATSFDDLASRIHYATKVSQYQQDVITTVVTLEAELQSQQEELVAQQEKEEQQVAELAERQEAADAAVAEMEAYYDQLSEELKQQIAAEEEAARQAAAAAAEQAAREAAERAAAEEAANSGSTDDDDSGSGGSGGGGNAPIPSGGMVSRALSVVGAGYSYTGYSWTGDVSTSYFTCSGLIDFALGLPPWSNSPESLYNSVGYIKTSTSELDYGDLVFYSYGGRYPGHVGIYIGDGCIVDSCPGGGVAIRSVNFMNFIGGGSL